MNTLSLGFINAEASLKSDREKMKTIYFYRSFPLLFRNFLSLFSTILSTLELITIEISPYNYYRIIFLFWFMLCIFHFYWQKLDCLLPLQYTLNIFPSDQKVHRYTYWLFHSHEWNGFFPCEQQRQFDAEWKWMKGIIVNYISLVCYILPFFNECDHLICRTSQRCSCSVRFPTKYCDNDE